MKWRVLLAMAAGLLLTLPLALALGTVLYPGGKPASKSGSQIIPVLTYGEYRELTTFDRPCRTQADCEAPLGCVQINPSGPSICAASDCMTDLQCPEDFTCRTLNTLDDSARVRLCILEGWRKEGEPCMQGLGVRGGNCARGLLCAAWCGRPCELDTPGSCPEGFFCRSGPDGPSCLPTCEGRTCPEGQRCIRFEGGTSICAEVRGQNCQETPCAEGSTCRRHIPRPRKQGLLVGMECVQPCGEGAPPCPEGLVCSSGECRRPCEPDTPGTCGPHEACRPDASKLHPVCKLQAKP